MLVCALFVCVCFFFFKQKTAYEMRISDWSSDVCSSDLLVSVTGTAELMQQQRQGVDQPLIGMTQLRMALNRDTPYKAELALARQLIGSDPESRDALAALEGNAASGAAILPGLRRDFTFVATQLGGTITRDRKSTRLTSSN